MKKTLAMAIVFTLAAGAFEMALAFGPPPYAFAHSGRRASVRESTGLQGEWQKAPLIDKTCLEKVKGDPDKHTTECLMQCANSGYGILTADGRYVKLDAPGDQKALAALKATDKTDHILVTVKGQLIRQTLRVVKSPSNSYMIEHGKGETLKVASLEIEK